MTEDKWPELHSCPSRRLRQLREDQKCSRHHLRREFQLQHLPSIIRKSGVASTQRSVPFVKTQPARLVAQHLPQELLGDAENPAIFGTEPGFNSASDACFLRVWVLILHLLDLHPAEEAWPGAVRVSYQGNVTSKKQNDTGVNGIGRL